MANRKVLVIDDSKVIRMRVKDMLPGSNFDVLEAKDGLEGYNMICSEKPNLIVLDFILPKMSGWDVYREIQKQNQLKSIPLVIMSGRKEEVMEKFSEPFENFAFMQKPFDEKKLVEAIKEAMSKAKGHVKAATETIPPAEVVPIQTDTVVSSENRDVQVLKAQVAHLQTEVDTLKRQVTQLITFIKQKLR